MTEGSAGTEAVPGAGALFSKKVYRLQQADWKRIRPELTRGILGKALSPTGAGDIDVTLTRVEPRGEFSLHRDPYHHVFYVFEGTGEVRLGEEVYPIRPETVVQVPAGEVHAYKNNGDTELILLTLNIQVGK
ncbi:MAG TPA: cupin domain-containing protein [Syntrophorhabdales bacterium]|nr:cupin domain-containing protein [Syntrophorhabdales bacterium]